MILNANDNILISHRRMFQHDEARYFLGQVVICEGDLMKVAGFSFVRDQCTGLIVKKNEPRLKVLSIASLGYIIYQLPDDVMIEKVTFQSGNGDAVLMQGTREIMNLSEHTHSGQF